MSDTKGFYKVRYVAGPYAGFRSVHADDPEEAVALVRAKIRKEMTLPMYAENYEAVELGGVPL